VRDIGDKPYRVAYDRMGLIQDNHVHTVHRTYPCIYSFDGRYPIPPGTHTNDKAYYPYGNSPYDPLGWNDLYLWDISTTLKNNWAGNQVELGIANCYHTFDMLTSGRSLCGDCSLLPLTDAELIRAYRLELKQVKKEAFKYDISDPFDGVFWEDHYHRFPKPEFPTISGDIKSAVVNNEILTVKVSMFYDNTGAGGSPGEKHLRGLWADRFDAANLEEPSDFDEQSPGEYILKYDVSGMDINSVLHLEVRDNVYDSHHPGGDFCELSKPIIFVSAIEKGLHWLRTQQNPDGSWQNSVGITSMSALAFLNADYTEDDPTVNKAIQYILANKNVTTQPLRIYCG
jgi:hypothetical protein